MPDIKIEENLISFISKKGIKYAAICRGTGITKDAMHAVKQRGRKLRADEFAKICIFLDEDPKKFMEMEEKDGSSNMD